MKRFSEILQELREHLPFTVLAALVGVGLLALIQFGALLTQRVDLLPKASQGLFHSFHLMHLFFSAIVTTAMFWRHDRRAGKAATIGFFGTLIPCGTSDLVIPFLGGKLLGATMDFHLCVAEHPFLVLPFLFGGILVGFSLPPIQRSTLFTHTGHVFLSSIASMLYLISFGIADWLRFLAMIFVLLIAAVMVPCCTSDIVFPLLFSRQDESQARAVHRVV